MISMVIPYTIYITCKKNYEEFVKKLVYKCQTRLIIFFLSQTVKHAVKIVCLILSLCPSNVSRLVNRRLPTDRTIGLMEGQKSDSLHGFTNLNSFFLAINVMIKNYYLFSPFVVDMKIV